MGVRQKCYSRESIENTYLETPNELSGMDFVDSGDEASLIRLQDDYFVGGAKKKRSKLLIKWLLQCLPIGLVSSERLVLY